MNYSNPIVSIFIFVLLICPIFPAHIGLFASTGCYSHDVMMGRFADQLMSIDGGSHRITLIQIRVYKFNRPFANHTPLWDTIIYDGRRNESKWTLRDFQRHMWTSLFPYDTSSLDDVSGVSILMQLHKHHINACYNALRDNAFMGKIRKLKLDLLVTDYVLNECALRFADLLDVNLLYFSNYPILSNYAIDLGLPSTPSYVPAVLGFDSSSMPFFRRCLNTFLYTLLWATRQWFDYDAHRTFKNALGNRYSTKRTSKVQYRRVLAFATPFEMMADTARPLTRNVHYFGCDHCANDEGSGERNGTTLQALNISSSFNGLILVSFGTVTKGDRIPWIQLHRLMSTFSNFPSYAFIWQLDVSLDYFASVLQRANLSAIPKNIHLVPWIPLKRLLADNRTILLISHGGVSTCLEAVHNSVPILGVALQGDQGYNLQRIVDKGLGEMIPISGLTEKMMTRKLAAMISNLPRYKKAAGRLRSLTVDYRSLYIQPPSVFWTSWLARHFGRTRNGTRTALLAERFLTLRYSPNWLIYYGFDILVFPFFLIVLAWRPSIRR